MQRACFNNEADPNLLPLPLRLLMRPQVIYGVVPNRNFNPTPTPSLYIPALSLLAAHCIFGQFGSLVLSYNEVRPPIDTFRLFPENQACSWTRPRAAQTDVNSIVSAVEKRSLSVAQAGTIMSAAMKAVPTEIATLLGTSGAVARCATRRMWHSSLSPLILNIYISSTCLSAVLCHHHHHHGHPPQASRRHVSEHHGHPQHALSQSSTGGRNYRGRACCEASPSGGQ